MPQQFENPANPEVHRRTTALEILDATDERLDAFVAGVGTGGTITGVGEVLKERRAGGARRRRGARALARCSPGGRARPHGIQGIGASFVPGILNRAVLDEVMQVRDEDAIDHGPAPGARGGPARGHLGRARTCGRPVRSPSGCPPSGSVVTVLCDTGERYLSVAF